MLTPSPTHPMPQDRGFGPFPDHEREAHIADCGRLMQAAMQRYAESGDLADLGDAHRWRSSGNRREGRAMSAFNWRTGQPSVMLPEGDTLGRSKRASDAVARKTAATGKNPGTITGISRKANKRDTDTAWSRSNSGVG